LSAATSSWNTLLVPSVSSRNGDFAFGGARIDLVVDIRDIANIFDVVGAVDFAQQAVEHVEDDQRPGVADMA